MQSYEKEALTLAGQEAGGWLESIGKTDLAQLTEAEWLMFLEGIVTMYQEHLGQICAAGEEPPF